MRKREENKEKIERKLEERRNLPECRGWEDVAKKRLENVITEESENGKWEKGSEVTKRHIKVRGGDKERRGRRGWDKGDKRTG